MTRARKSRRTPPRRRGGGHRPGHYPGSGRSAGSGKAVKLLAIAALPIAVVGGGSYFLMEHARTEKIGADYCYQRAGQPQHVVFLDNSYTKDLSGAQYRDLHTAYMRAYDTALPNTRISLMTTAADVNGSLPVPAYTACRPAATVAEQEAIGAPSSTPMRLANQAQDARAEYETQVDALIADAANPDKAAGDSPILEQLQAISRDPALKSSRRQMTVITDGIQNSEIARFCQVQGDMPRFGQFEASTGYQFVKPDNYAGTKINLLLVEFGELPAPGMDYCSNDEVRAWWPDYFKANGAKSVELTRLRYWANAS